MMDGFPESSDLEVVFFSVPVFISGFVAFGLVLEDQYHTKTNELAKACMRLVTEEVIDALVLHAASKFHLDDSPPIPAATNIRACFQNAFCL